MGTPSEDNMSASPEPAPRVTVDENVLGGPGCPTFRVVWSVQDYWADVTVYEHSGDEADADRRYLYGFIKADGCTELDMGRPHWCGPHFYKLHCQLLSYIYRRAFELMGQPTDDRWNWP